MTALQDKFSLLCGGEWLSAAPTIKGGVDEMGANKNGRSQDEQWSFPERLLKADLSRRNLLRYMAQAAGFAAAGFVVPDLLEACTTTTQPSQVKGKLTFALSGDPVVLDPGKAGRVAAAIIEMNLFDRLVGQLPGKGYFPGLATSWDVSPDATTFTFKLRQGVKFHDGTDFDANAVKATYDHIVDPATKSGSARPQLGPYKETRILDKYTAQIVFSAPNAQFLYVQTNAPFSISSPAALAKYGLDYPSNPVGTGPFRLKQFVAGQSVLLERNPDYAWNPAPLGRTGPALIQELEFRILPEAATRGNALRTGEVQLAYDVSAQDAKGFANDRSYSVNAVSTVGIPYSYAINTAKAPMNDINVRRAIQYAVDRDAIAKTVFANVLKPANTPWTPSTPGFDPDVQFFDHDPNKAKQLLDAAGWTSTSSGVRQKGGVNLQISVLNENVFYFDLITQLVQAQFKEVGIDLRIDVEPAPAVYQDQAAGKDHMASYEYHGLNPYGAIVECADIGPDGYNYMQYCNPDVDKLIQDTASVVDDAKRSALYKQIYKILVEAAILLPLISNGPLIVGKSNVKDIAYTINAYPLFHNVTLA